MAHFKVVRIHMSEAIDKVWKEIWKRWSASNSISRFSWDCESVAREHPELEDRVFKTLSHENRFLVAHCLITLEAMRSSRLCALPPTLFERHGRMTVICGSFAREYTLGRLAHEIATKFEQSRCTEHGDDVGVPNRTPPAPGR